MVRNRACRPPRAVVWSIETRAVERTDAALHGMARCFRSRRCRYHTHTTRLLSPPPPGHCGGVATSARSRIRVTSSGRCRSGSTCRCRSTRGSGRRVARAGGVVAVCSCGLRRGESLARESRRVRLGASIGARGHGRAGGGGPSRVRSGTLSVGVAGYEGVRYRRGVRCIAGMS